MEPEGFRRKTGMKIKSQGTHKKEDVPKTVGGIMFRSGGLVNLQMLAA
jgi:hypothetical protein